MDPGLTEINMEVGGSRSHSEITMEVGGWIQVSLR